MTLAGDFPARREQVEQILGLPPRPVTRDTTMSTDWHARAACAEDDIADEDRQAFTTVERQDDAWDLVATYCDACPVASLCLEDGRNVHGWGLYGGLVLKAGHLAREGGSVKTYGSFRDPEHWRTPAWAA